MSNLPRFLSAALISACPLFLTPIPASAQDAPRGVATDASATFGQELSSQLGLQPLHTQRTTLTNAVPTAPSTANVAKDMAPAMVLQDDYEDEDDELIPIVLQDGTSSRPQPDPMDDVEWEWEETKTAPAGPSATPRAPAGPTANGATANFEGLQVTRLKFESPEAAQAYALEGDARRVLRAAGVKDPNTASFAVEQRGAYFTVISGDALADPDLTREALRAAFNDLEGLGPAENRMVYLPGNVLVIESTSKDPRFASTFARVAEQMRESANDRGDAQVHGESRALWYGFDPEQTQAAREYAEAFLSEVAPAANGNRPESAPKPTVGLGGALRKAFGQ